MRKKMNVFAMLGIILVITGIVILVVTTGVYKVNIDYNYDLLNIIRNNNASDMNTVHEYGEIDSESPFFSYTGDQLFEEIEIDFAGGILNITTGTEFSVSGENINRDKFKYSFDDGKLFIEYNKKITLFDLDDWSHDEKLDIVIPVSSELEKADIELTGGKLDINGISCEEFDIDISAGEVYLYWLNVSDSTEFNLTAGDISCYDSVFNNLKYEMTAGYCNFENTEFNKDSSFELTAGALETNNSSMLGDSKINMTAGSVTMNLSGDKDKYDTNISRTAGNVDIIGFSSASAYDDKYNMDIKVTAGDCMVNFTGK